MGQIFDPQLHGLSDLSDPRRMAERIMAFKPASDAEALKLLRASFPASPLSMRVAALAFLSLRQQQAARLHGH